MAFDPDYENAAFALYRYPPSLAAAVIFILLFLFLTLYHAYILFRTRSWFMIAFFIGGVFEFIGFCSRAKSAKQEPGYWTLMPYIVQNLFLLLAPALFAASIYMILGRIVRVTDGARCSLIKPRWMTRVFVAGDVFSFLMQSAGGGMMAMSSRGEAFVKNGNNLIIGGLFIQLFFFGFFMVISVLFHRRLGASPTSRSMLPEVKWRKWLYVLYVCSMLIMVRSVFRVVEYLQGHNGALLRKEVWLYIFDATLMVGVMVVMAVWHPEEVGRVLRVWERQNFIEDQEEMGRVEMGKWRG